MVLSALKLPTSDILRGVSSGLKWRIEGGKVGESSDGEGGERKSKTSTKKK